MNNVNIMYFSEDNNHISISSCHDNIQQNARQILNSKQKFLETESYWWCLGRSCGTLYREFILTNMIKLQTPISKDQDTNQPSFLLFGQHSDPFKERMFGLD